VSDVQQTLQAALGDAYTLERELGGGGMSRTFVAVERALERRVVVKVLSPELLAGVSVERFKREILMAAALQHPHIVPVLSSGDAGGLPWFTMPYVEGDSLRLRLARGGPVSIAEITGVLRDVARALEFAHDRGVVHRDIKPDNVLLAGSSATVTDFGIAKALAAARTTPGGAGLTGAGMVMGTPAYMAPEQAAGDPTVDHRADLYAFGVMAYELLAGKPPFVADTQARLIGAHFSEVPRDVRELRPDTPAVLADLVMHLLAKEPGDRPQDAALVVRILDSVSSGGRVGLSMASGEEPLHLGKALLGWSGAAAVVVLTAWAASRAVGLPDWVLPGAGGLMLAGLPAVLGTWYVQRATRTTPASAPRTPGPGDRGPGPAMARFLAPYLSWKRTLTGGAVAIGAFATVVLGFMVMRAFGLGPMGSLRGAGQFGDRETLVVADFRPPPGDSSLGETVAEAIRTDLAQSPHLRVLTRATIREVLQLMGRAPEAAVAFDVAQEVAVREGAKAVLDGEVVQLGPSFVISARLVSAADGRELAVFRRTAANDGELVAALGALSHDVRGKVGESLRDIRDAEPLERLTTTSLTALRKYVEADEILASLGDYERGQQLLREALAEDSTFAMAWRRLAASYVGTGRDQGVLFDAIGKAYAFRDRLSENERLLTEASHFSYGPTPDLDRSIAAYEALLARDSTNTAALNNAATRYQARRNYTRAAELLERATRVPNPFGGAFHNLTDVYLTQGDLAAAERTADRFARALPNNPQRGYSLVAVLVARGALDSALTLVEAGMRSSPSPTVRSQSAAVGESVALLRGQVREALRWGTRRDEALRNGGPQTPQQALQTALDSAFVIAMFHENTSRARAIVRAAVTRVPLESLPVAERNWEWLARVAQAAGDADLAEAAMRGRLRDSAAVSLAPGLESWFRGTIALAAARGDEAVESFRDAERHRLQHERAFAVEMAYAFDVAGRPDSAIAYYERFVRHPRTKMELDQVYLAGSYKRLGELYDARGEAAKAEEFYQRFVEVWQDADPELQPKVRRARERMNELRRARG